MSSFHLIPLLLTKKAPRLLSLYSDGDIRIVTQTGHLCYLDHTETREHYFDHHRLFGMEHHCRLCLPYTSCKSDISGRLEFISEHHNMSTILWTLGHICIIKCFQMCFWFIQFCFFAIWLKTSVFMYVWHICVFVIVYYMFLETWFLWYILCIDCLLDESGLFVFGLNRLWVKIYYSYRGCLKTSALVSVLCLCRSVHN